MTSENPFDKGGALRAAVTGNDVVEAADLPDDPETGKAPGPEVDIQLVPPLDVEVEDEPPAKPNVRVKASSKGKSGPTQIQHSADENDVDDESTGETPSENDDEDAVNAEVVEDGEEPQDAETSTDLAEWTPPPFPSIEADWAHETIEYGGFKLGVRIPNSQGLTGFTMATGQFIPDLVRQAMISKFVNLHLSPQSYAFLMLRLMDPDAVDFNEETFGEVIRILVEMGGERVIAAAEAKAAAEKKLQKKGKR